MNKFIVVIPARYNSTRLPGKPLIDIAGKPMIQRVYEQCLKVVSKELVYIATDDLRIKKVAESFGSNILLTSEDCLTGTDRVAEIARRIKADYYINVQGDEPLFNPHDIQRCIDSCKNHFGDIINGYAPLLDEEQYQSRSIPKVVFRPDKRLLYMSRSPIPGNKMNVFQEGYRQICIYGFPRNALMQFSEYRRKSPLESNEDIEILRFLELGWEVRMIEMTNDSISVDNPEDVIRVLERINE